MNYLDWRHLRDISYIMNKTSSATSLQNAKFGKRSFLQIMDKKQTTTTKNNNNNNNNKKPTTTTTTKNKQKNKQTTEP